MVGLPKIFKIQIFFSVYVLIAFVDCSGKKNSLGIAYDLVSELNKATTRVVGGISSSDPIPYHWKKNPGRYSGLPTGRKWENTQITFNTNKLLFINHSLDSIYFVPNASYEFQLEAGDYDFVSQVGALPNSSVAKHVSGIFVIEADDKEVYSKSFDSVKPETWINLALHLKIQKKVKFIWKSQVDHFFLAEPLLYASKFRQRPNVIVIVLDSARKDFFSSYGFPYPITPNMDKLASESVVFENPFSNGNWTKPSMMSFFHSEYSSNLGLGNSWFTTKPYQRQVYYGKKRNNLVTAMRREGYYTKSIMNNVFFLDYTTVGIDLGFHNSYQVGMDILDTEELTTHALDFISEIGDKPFFLHFNLNTPHGSYAPPTQDMAEVSKIIPNEPFRKFESPVQRYIGEMFYTDRKIGELVKKLKEKNIYDNTMIILTGDHGELFSAHHDYSYHFIMKTRFGHGETHYDEEINVPYFFKLPRSIVSKKERITGQSSLLSLLPTTLGLLNLNSEPNDFKGVNYADCIISGEPCPKEEMIYTEGRMSESVRTEDYLYIRRYPGFTAVSRKIDGELHPMQEELYDLKIDPDQKLNLSRDSDQLPLLLKARSDFIRGNFLKRNRVVLRLPACLFARCKDQGDLIFQGSVYDWKLPINFKILSSSAKTIHFEGESGKEPSEFIFYTVNPELETSLRFYRNGFPVSHRLGKWGIEPVFSSGIRSQEFILSDRIPLGWKTADLPWLYNDGAFSGGSESSAQKEMGKEVKKILETWGYIHE